MRLALFSCQLSIAALLGCLACGTSSAGTAVVAGRMMRASLDSGAAALTEYALASQALDAVAPYAESDCCVRLPQVPDTVGESAMVVQASDLHPLSQFLQVPRHELIAWGLAVIDQGAVPIFQFGIEWTDSIAAGVPPAVVDQPDIPYPNARQ